MSPLSIHGALYLTSAILIACAAITESCSRSEDVRPLPRREAFPRIDTYDTIYTCRSVGGVALDINAAATVTEPGSGWLDISYPRYNATVHVSVVTATDSAAMDEAVRNRLQRIDLNLGEATATMSRYTAGDFSCRLIVSPDAGRTPVQFLAIGNDRLISATAVMNGSTTPVDSIRPIVDALAEDARRLIGTNAGNTGRSSEISDSAGR